mmetsp:Transcript_4958/g.10622  ORF Transcript_4958/g.10622 Transcript_4958/m.10622 type:complete len:225 (+) Transcript_4958:890-1564(+)
MRCVMGQKIDLLFQEASFFLLPSSFLSFYAWVKKEQTCVMGCSVSAVVVPHSTSLKNKTRDQKKKKRAIRVSQKGSVQPFLCYSGRRTTTDATVTIGRVTTKENQHPSFLLSQETQKHRWSQVHFPLFTQHGHSSGNFNMRNRRHSLQELLTCEGPALCARCCDEEKGEDRQTFVKQRKNTNQKSSFRSVETFLKEYTILRPLGTGQYGAVHLAEKKTAKRDLQ